MNDLGPGTAPPDEGGGHRYGRGAVWAAVTAVGTLLGALVPLIIAQTNSPSPPIVVGGGGTSTSSAPKAVDPPTTPTRTTDPPAPDPPTSDPPTSDPPTSDPPRGELNAAEQELADFVTNDALSSCFSSTASVSGASAVINCRVPDGGPSRNPLAIAFETRSDLNTWMAGEKDDYTVTDSSARCTAGDDFKGTWNYKGARTGQLACHRTDAGYFRIAWSFDERLVVVVASNKDETKLITWWKATPVTP